MVDPLVWSQALEDYGRDSNHRFSTATSPDSIVRAVLALIADISEAIGPNEA